MVVYKATPKLGYLYKYAVEFCLRMNSIMNGIIIILILNYLNEIRSIKSFFFCIISLVSLANKIMHTLTASIHQNLSNCFSITATHVLHLIIYFMNRTFCE